MAISGKGYIKRQDFMIFANVGDSGEEWEVIGERIEEMSVEMNPNVETVTDILGNTVTTLDKYEPQTEVSPMRAKRESLLFQKLYQMVRDEKVLSDAEMEFLCVCVFDTDGDSYAAWKQNGVVAVESMGGSSEGLEIPFTIHWTGAKTYGTFRPESKTFTAS